jgi:glycosyltransferase involved in cell wall biosynthesis
VELPPPPDGRTRAGESRPSTEAREVQSTVDAGGWKRIDANTKSGAIQVAALIPALNEANAIASVVDGIRPLVDRVFVVDDGSEDATAERAAAAGAEVLRHARNAGKGRAVRTGLERILDAPFTHVLLLDGDMQHLPREAARLIETAAESGADLVLGERVFRREQMPSARYHANRLGSRVLSWFVGVRLRDTQCGFRIFRVDALRPIRLTASGYEIETEMLVKITRRGGRLASVPITAVYANERSKLRPVRDTTRTCFLAVYYRFLERV